MDRCGGFTLKPVDKGDLFGNFEGAKSRPKRVIFAYWIVGLPKREVRALAKTSRSLAERSRLFGRGERPTKGRT